MADKIMQNSIQINKMKIQPDIVPSTIIKKKFLLKAPKMNTSAIIKNDKEVRDLISPKIKVLSNITIKKGTNVPLAKKSSTNYRQIKPNIKVPTYVQTQPSLQTIIKEQFTPLFASDVDAANQIQREMLAFSQNGNQLNVVNNNVMFANENINMVINEIEVATSQQKNLELPDNNSRQSIGKPNILKNTKYVFTKKVVNISPKITNDFNGNLYKTTPVKIVPGKLFATSTSQNSTKSKKYVRKPKNPGNQTQKPLKIKAETKLAPKLGNQGGNIFPDWQNAIHVSPDSEIVNSDGTAFVMIPLENIQQVQKNEQFSVNTLSAVNNIPDTVVSMDSIGNENNLGNIQTEWSTQFTEEMVQENVFSGGEVNLPSSSVTRQGYTTIRKVAATKTDKKKPRITKKPKKPAAPRKSKYDELIDKYSKPIQPQILPKNVTTPGYCDTEQYPMLGDKIHMDATKKFPAIVPNNVYINLAQSDILEKAISTIIDHGIVPVNNSKPLCTQRMDRNSISSDLSAKMFYERYDPMLPQYSTNL